MYNKVTAIIFSATGNTKKYAERMLKASGLKTELIDLTTVKEPLNKTFNENELVIVGSPVYGGRIPKVARERFSKIKGDKTDIILLACYGNRHFDDALAEMSDLFEENGFITKVAGAVVGKHTYGEIQVDRPNETDLKEIEAFMKTALSMPNGVKINVPGNRPYKDGGNGGKFRPTTKKDKCSSCGLCISECPVGAIKDDLSTTDNCISCFRCINICPEGAKSVDTEEYLSFAKTFSQKLSQRRENEFYL